MLDSLPEWLRKMDDTYGDGLKMGESAAITPHFERHEMLMRAVSKPNMNLPVLVYCRRDCGEITLEE